MRGQMMCAKGLSRSLGQPAPAHETPEAREYRDQTQRWLEWMRRDAEHRGLNLVVEIPSDWPEL